MAEVNVVAMVPAAHWAGGRFPREAVPLTISEKHRIIQEAIPQNLEAAEDGSLEIMACAGNPAQEAPAMWMESLHSPIMGNITRQKQRQG